MLLRQIRQHPGMTQGEELELNLQKLGLRIAYLFQDVTGHCPVSSLFVFHILDTIAQSSRIAPGGEAAQGEKHFGLTGEVRIKRSATTASFRCDILNARGLKAVPGKDHFGCTQQLSARTLGLHGLL